jgi:hypothetical protein
MKTGANPLKAKLKLYFKWGIKLDESDPYIIPDRGARPAAYTSKDAIEATILAKYPPANPDFDFDFDDPVPPFADGTGGESMSQRRRPGPRLRT